MFQPVRKWVQLRRKVERFSLQLVGLWPAENTTNPRLCRLKGFLAALISILILVYDCHTTISMGKNIKMFAWYAIEAVTMVTIVVKLVSLLAFRDTLLYLMNVANGHISKERSVEEEDVRKIWNTLLSFASNQLTLVYLSAWVSYSMAPLFWQERNFPLSGKLPQLFYETPWYEIVFVLQVAAICVVCSGLLVYDVLSMVFVCHLCSEFKCVEIMLDRMGLPGSDLGAVVARHTVTLEFGDCFCKFLAPSVLSQVILSSVSICLSVYPVIKFLTTDSMAIARTIIVLLTILTQLFVFCWAGETVSSASTKVGNAVGRSSWPTCKKNEQKAALLILVRAQKPFTLAAGGFCQLNIRSFAELIYCALSYVTVLKALEG